MIPGGQTAALGTGAVQPGTNLVLIQGPPSDLPLSIAWAIGAALLVAAGAYAMRIHRAGGQHGIPRARRVLITAFAWAVVVTTMGIPPELARSTDASILVDVTLGLAFSALFAAALFVGLDLVLDFFRPERTAGWLPAAAFLFAVLPAAAVAVSDLPDLLPLSDDAGWPGLLPAGAVAGLIWWTRLLPPNRELTHVFE